MGSVRYCALCCHVPCRRLTCTQLARALPSSWLWMMSSNQRCSVSREHRSTTHILLPRIPLCIHLWELHCLSLGCSLRRCVATTSNLPPPPPPELLSLALRRSRVSLSLSRLSLSRASLSLSLSRARARFPLCGARVRVFRNYHVPVLLSCCVVRWV